MHDGLDAGPWPAFVDLLAAATMLFVVLFAVIAIPSMRRAEEASGVRTRLDTLNSQLARELSDKRVEVVRRATGLFLRIDGDATFPKDAAGLGDLRAEAKVILRGLAEVVGAAGADSNLYQLQVVGHASREGASTNNWFLSAARAAAVAQFLVDSLRLNACKVSAVGRAMYYPVDTSATAMVADPRSRRIEIEVLPRFGSDTAQSELLQQCRK